MKRLRRRNYAEWLDRWGTVAEYDLHPGSVLAKHMQWTKPTDGYASMHGPEPDTINVGVLAPYMIALGLEHEYYYRVEQGPLWVSFGWSADPKQTLAAITRPVVATWSSDNARAPREIKYHTMPDNIMAKNFPQEHRWQYSDIGDY